MRPPHGSSPGDRTAERPGPSVRERGKPGRDDDGGWEWRDRTRPGRDWRDRNDGNRELYDQGRYDRGAYDRHRPGHDPGGNRGAYPRHRPHYPYYRWLYSYHYPYGYWYPWYDPVLSQLLWHYPFWSSSPYWSYGYYGAPWYSYYGDYWYYPYYRPLVRISSGPTQGALDLDVVPEDTDVYLDGYLIGVADDFDGWPRYLWLDEGQYELIFYNPGYETVVRKFVVTPDVVQDVRFQMEPGESVLPELLSTVGLRTESPVSSASEYLFPATSDAWAAEPAADPGGDEAVGEAEAARLVLSIEPANASIYLDGRFVGTGEEFDHAGLVIDPGEHLIQVMHPRFSTREKTFTVEPGDQLELGFSLGQ